MRVERWERRTEGPLTLLAVAFLVAYAWTVLDTQADQGLEDFLQTVTWTVWAAFATDLGIRLLLAEQRMHYALKHWYDFPLVALPVLRPLRLLRLVALLRILDRSTVNTLAGRVVVYVTSGTVVAVFLGSLATLDAERHAPGATITTFGNALWWSATTVTTVGYGDFYPVTFQGRVVAVVLMIVGVALVGSVTAAMATWLLRRVAEERDSNTES